LRRCAAVPPLPRQRSALGAPLCQQSRVARLRVARVRAVGRLRPKAAGSRRFCDCLQVARVPAMLCLRGGLSTRCAAIRSLALRSSCLALPTNAECLEVYCRFAVGKL
jgi:hypothetical protein